MAWRSQAEQQARKQTRYDDPPYTACLAVMDHDAPAQPLYEQSGFESRRMRGLYVALAFAFYGCGYASKAAGLGRPLEALRAQQDGFDRLNALILSSNLIWIAALCLSKLAIVSMLIRLTQRAAHQRHQYLVGVLVGAQFTASILLMTVECTGFDGLAWEVRSNDMACSRQQLRWHVITGLDVATELAILILPLHLVWKLQMSRKSKSFVVVAFWLRIPTIAFSILRNDTTNRLRSTPDTSLSAAMILIWQAIELTYSIAAATIAALKQFTESLNTGFGHGELIRVHGQSQSYKLSDRSTSTKNSKASKPASSVNADEASHARKDEVSVPRVDVDSSQMILRSDNGQNEVTVSSQSEGSLGWQSLGRSDRSEENSIWHDVQYLVHYDEEPLATGLCVL
ncbi:hypothetical protein OPT61_g8811 [Boeremia exigua]|uniref:Uncharacterized protein n=1 Tax=Boeremia exigua TaxID=749465 RepID=A0ACC2HXG2_9PLEO|nr:hypothetical protein OPT61_g8811 [Boeremia exigua]